MAAGSSCRSHCLSWALPASLMQINAGQSWSSQHFHHDYFFHVPNAFRNWPPLPQEGLHGNRSPSESQGLEEDLFLGQGIARGQVLTTRQP